VVALAAFDRSARSLASSRSWALAADGAIRHRSGRFFAVVGVREQDGWSYPLLAQPEVGLLCFAVAGCGDERRWLAQMKVEPGNVGGAQVAPTVQATRSNLDGVHHGRPTPLVHRVSDSRCEVVADGLWSEQGSRFLGKRNRNRTVRWAAPDDPPDRRVYRWLDAPTMRSLLAADFAVNTDARSVLATAPWRLLAGARAPFEPDARLAASYSVGAAAGSVRPPGTAMAAAEGPCTAVGEVGPVGAARDLLARHRLRAATVVPLAEVRGLVLDPHDDVPVRHRWLDVAHVAVHAETRERARWDQPLVRSSGEGLVALLLQAGDDGVLRAVLAVDHDAGLPSGPELTATIVAPPGSEVPPLPEGAELLADVRASDEGGRFDHDVSRVVVAIDHGPPVPQPPGSGPGAPALTLGELEHVVRTPGLVTNELRTAAAVLLSLA
jgi:dTDP-4-dehydro-6-deoxy-alpha-D-glucopyranose 2,3-dehydratase